MRHAETGPVLKLRAIAGLHVVTLAWDFVNGPAAAKKDLLGFAIERTEFDFEGNEIEQYFLRGIKRFRDKDEGVAAGTPLPTSEHPVQSFQWGDYTVKPATRYAYRVIPARGKSKLLRLDEASSTTVQVSTESEEGALTAGKTRHDIYFNRGAAGSQAYARRFGKTKPDAAAPDSEQMRWLSRGLFEALIGFIDRAAGQDAADYKLRAVLYEFRYAPVGEAFRKAAEAGADVDIRYEAQSYVDENEEMIREVGIEDICRQQDTRSGIRHNKFVVLLHKDRAVAVWTGSTNISAGGIFGHSNVGHVVWSEAVARQYLAYWKQLAQDEVKTAALAEADRALRPTPPAGELPPSDSVLALFSPRDGEDVRTLKWYASLMAQAQSIVCITFAFNLDDVFLAELTRANEVLRYAVFDKDPAGAAATSIEQHDNTVIAVGSKLDRGDLVNFLAERLTGFNSNYYIHDKFFLVDPLGPDPIVVTGSANFSKPSQKTNDENMLVIRGDTRVADIYFGEYMRIFDHFYARYMARRVREAENTAQANGKRIGAGDGGYLAETTGKWLQQHFKPGRKQLRRLYFMGET